ncbi:dipeptide/oligopeptide/nickel ABC transporter permease/ATP-binding protein [Amycolatopsis sp. GM8]|uniref:dipeptide/oligopeptide/nickel ABC transporter permease/ATP-binding protein n=1 Tax=Amycolatopsis sp. GM8 TaxID=2896530 RepID=UPI001F1811E2|nr:dipeptide/oligopeptide/nickel ABC transporter permease/ATP-binding protein [Amycolatopsis sp. GM8]
MRYKPWHALRSPRAVSGLAGVLLLVFMMVFAPHLWADAASAANVAERLQRPSGSHPLGTDQLGRDLLARVLVATRLSLLLTLGSTAIAVCGGVVLGMVATVVPRVLRRGLTALLEILMSFPWLLLTLFFTVIWGASAKGALLAVGFAGIPTVARLTYTMSSSVAGRDFVRAARIVGVGPLGILGRHVLPNIRPVLVVNAAAVASVTLLSFTGLSFLGLGVQAPDYDWGRLLAEGVGKIYVNPVAALGPGVAVLVTALILNTLGALASEAAGRTPRIAGKAAPRLRAARIPASADEPVVEVEDLRVSFPDGSGGLVERVAGVSFTIRPGETVGIVGASGSGKSVTAMAIAGLLGPAAHVRATTLRFQDIDMSGEPDAAARRKLGLGLSVVFQDPLTSLNPVLTIGRQLTEVSEVHGDLGRRDARRRAQWALSLVGIPLPARRARQYPHQLSGGMRQRVMIGMGLMGTPALLIADEPTTALDVTVQQNVLRVLHQARERTGSAILFISHDIALVSGFCDRVLVMKDGLIVEELDARQLDRARHPYTRALIACVPHMTTDRTRPLPVIADFDGSEDAEEIHA